ncbi:hypothetical protein ACIQ9P_39185 [Kitasatospora sp. NPDC094019]|uniref:hypothetical protein n=1 Tax=Kitasatospora sp. NPDC094019 TaxID=3364091 RepID=UPI0037F4E4D8
MNKATPLWAGSPRRPDPAPAPGSGPSPERAFAEARRAACTDPQVRFGPSDRLADLEVFGGHWYAVSWDDPRAGDVHQVLQLGRRVGWTAPRPDGPWGRPVTSPPGTRATGQP